MLVVLVVLPYPFGLVGLVDPAEVLPPAIFMLVVLVCLVDQAEVLPPAIVVLVVLVVLAVLVGLVDLVDQAKVQSVS